MDSKNKYQGRCIETEQMKHPCFWHYPSRRSDHQALNSRNIGTILKALASSKTSVIATMILQNSQREKPETIGILYYHLMSQKKLNEPDYTSSPKSNCQSSLLGKKS